MNFWPYLRYPVRKSYSLHSILMLPLLLLTMTNIIKNQFVVFFLFNDDLRSIISLISAIVFVISHQPCLNAA